ncbi:MAG: 2-C-methyl-D-erythritol 4-phosphate cytidylyltransferase [Tepidisphaeraceae bacterium]|jgi:2-C-methyl-D-erythritol 4-phosphate cytidylyltransferase
MPDFAVIVPAAGSSSRFGSANKLLQPLGGRPVLTWTLGCFAGRADVRQIVVAAADADAVADCVRRLEPSQRDKVKLCPGGRCRAESVRSALQATSEQIPWVAVHDAARPLASAALIDRVFAAAIQHGAAAAAVAAQLTIKQALGPLPAPVIRTLPRDQLWTMQTPQAMARRDLLDAFAACPIPLADVTDDLQLLELLGKQVWLVEGEERNLKITTPTDLQLASALIS